jgi:hypothetical protein
MFLTIWPVMEFASLAYGSEGPIRVPGADHSPAAIHLRPVRIAQTGVARCNPAVPAPSSATKIG